MDCLIQSSWKPYDAGTNIPILQMLKLRFREIKHIVQVSMFKVGGLTPDDSNSVLPLNIVLPGIRFQQLILTIT